MTISVLVLCEIGSAQKALLQQRCNPTFALTAEDRQRLLVDNPARLYGF